MSLAAQHPFLILLQSTIANGVYNLDSTRFQKAMLDSRQEGWTEVWGNGKDETLQGDASNDDESSNVLVFEDTTHSVWIETEPHTHISIVLTQFRPAWLEQMVLKMASLKFIVVNSTHSCNEATGPLPHLREVYNHRSILVGRHHPSNLLHEHSLSERDESHEETHASSAAAVYGNSILAYLQGHRHVNLDAHLQPLQLSMALSFRKLIEMELQPILLLLRYEDRDAWEQVYRRQHIHASCPHPWQRQGTPWVMQWRGKFQAMMERAVERRRLLEFARRGQRSAAVGIQEAIARARMGYQALEQQLITVGYPDKTSQTYLLGTQRPALVDAVLWAHLAEALCDVHLVVVLADFPYLVQYFQDLYEMYFATSKPNKSNGMCWEAWNQRQNLENAFQQIPILAKNQLTKHRGFQDAIDLMQSLSLQKQELQEVLGAVKAKRNEEQWPKPRKGTASLLYRWCMGEEMDKSTEKKDKEDENPLRQKLLRDQMRNDQKWISGVAGISLVAILLLQSGATSTDT
jgi:hypothetical protein